MGTLGNSKGDVAFQWASDVQFDGIRLEALNEQGDVLFDVSVPEAGEITVNTFSNEISATLIAAAVDLARERK